MSAAKQLAHRFKEVMLDGKLVANTNYLDLIHDISRDIAQQKVSGLNTIEALIFHINYYVEGVLNVFNGRELTIRDKYSFDYTKSATDAEWDKLRDRLFINAKAFGEHAASFSEAELTRPFVKETYGSYEQNIQVMIEHCYYHLGQVSIIKKMILEAESG